MARMVLHDSIHDPLTHFPSRSKDVNFFTEHPIGRCLKGTSNYRNYRGQTTVFHALKPWSVPEYSSLNIPPVGLSHALQPFGRPNSSLG